MMGFGQYSRCRTHFLWSYSILQSLIKIPACMFRYSLALKAVLAVMLPSSSMMAAAASAVAAAAVAAAASAVRLMMVVCKIFKTHVQNIM